MPHQLSIARQPIISANNEVFGYEFFYRDLDDPHLSNTTRASTSSVLVNLLNQIGLRKGIGDAKAFINIDSDILLTDILDNLPSERFVFEISEQMRVTHREIEAVATLRAKGYEFALDNVSLNSSYQESFSPLFPYISYLKFDTTQTDIELLSQQIDTYKDFSLIAQKVEFSELFEAYRDLGFDYFQGYYFAKPSLIQENRIDPKHLGVLHLYEMLQNEAPEQEIYDTFQQHNELSMQLLQFASSTGLTADSGNASIREIIERMGTLKLQQWLMMILFSRSAQSIASEKNPHSLMIERRIDLMLQLMALLHPNNTREMEEQIRFLAFVSMLEPVFNVPIAAILEMLHVTQPIRDAIKTNTGPLGRLFALTLAIERSDFAAVQVLLKPLQINMDDIVDIVEAHLYS